MISFARQDLSKHFVYAIMNEAKSPYSGLIPDRRESEKG